MITKSEQVPGSTLYASSLAYGDFILADGGTIHCDGIQGISGVATARLAKSLADGKAQVDLNRIVTHFYWPDPPISIEQHPSKPSTGTLTGNGGENATSLLPGTATFSQYIILTFNGRPLANRAPLVMTAHNVTNWPPVGSDFYTEGPTDFYDLADLDNPQAPVVATLAACKNSIMHEIMMPQHTPGQTTTPIADQPAPPTSDEPSSPGDE